MQCYFIWFHNDCFTGLLYWMQKCQCNCGHSFSRHDHLHRHQKSCKGQMIPSLTLHLSTARQQHLEVLYLEKPGKIISCISYSTKMWPHALHHQKIHIVHSGSHIRYLLRIMRRKCLEWELFGEGLPDTPLNNAANNSTNYDILQDDLRLSSDSDDDSVVMPEAGKVKQYNTRIWYQSHWQFW